MPGHRDPGSWSGARKAIVIVKELQPLFNGEHSLILDDGTRLTLSRKYKDKLFELLGKPL